MPRTRTDAPALLDRGEALGHPALLDRHHAERGTVPAQLVVIRCTAPGCPTYHTTEIDGMRPMPNLDRFWRSLGWRHTTAGTRCRDHRDPGRC
jgi:hypothetical protein